MLRLSLLVLWLAACQVRNPAYDVVGDDGDARGDARADARADAGANVGSDALGLLDGGSDLPAMDTRPRDDGQASRDGNATADTAITKPSAGLVAHLRADEGSGDVLADATGGPQLYAKSTFSWIAGASGQPGDHAIRFSATGYATTAPANAAPAVLGLADRMTFATWLNWDQPGDKDQALLAFVGRMYHIRLGTSTFRRVCVNVTTTETFADCGRRDIPVGAWTHIAVTYDGTDVRLFINGQEDVDARFRAPGPVETYSSAVFTVAGIGERGNDPLAGALDDVRIYDRALSADEVAALAK